MPSFTRPWLRASSIFGLSRWQRVPGSRHRKSEPTGKPKTISGRLLLEHLEERTLLSTLASVFTDQPDYAPGATAVIGGIGFQPDEAVTLQVVHSDGLEGGAGHEPWLVMASSGGSFTSTWYVNPDDSLGATFVLTAFGSLGSFASATFTDGNIKVFAAPTGVTFTLTATEYAATGCPTGSEKPGSPTTHTASWEGGGTTFGVGNTESIRLEAAVNSNEGRQFLRWELANGAFEPAPSPALPTTSRSICVPGFSGEGSHSVRASYGFAPVAVADSYSTDEDSTLVVAAPGVLANDSDADGESLTAVVASGPLHGSLTLNPNGSFTYNPAQNYNGPDSFSYRASDGVLQSSMVTVSLTVNPVNDPPVLAPISVSPVDEETLVGFTANGSDIDGDTLSYSLVSAPSGAAISSSSGQFTWTPNEAQDGTANFTVCVSESIAAPVCQPVSLTVLEVNRAPALSGVPTALSVVKTTPVTFNATATDVDRVNPGAVPNTLAFSLVGAPAGATIDGSTGAFSWTPTEDQGPGNFSFTVRVTDNGSPNLFADRPITITTQAAGIVAGNLLVVGTSGNDIISVNAAVPSSIAVNVNGTTWGPFALPTGGRIITSGFAGNDSYALVPGSPLDVRDTAGTDLIDFSAATSGTTIDLSLDAGQVQTVNSATNTISITGTFENVIGSAFGDSITGNAVANLLEGRGGNDTLSGGLGNDILDGGADTDELGETGGGFTLTANPDGSFNLSGASGTDLLKNIEGIEFGGSAGSDVMDASAFDGSVTLDGGEGDDVIVGGSIESNSDLLIGGLGNDRITGGVGGDVIFGGKVDSTEDPTNDNDSIFGGDGADTVFGGSGADTIFGGDGADIFTSSDSIFGGDGADFIMGGDGISGGDGADFVNGGSGNDTIFGGDGADLSGSTDTIFGGDGADLIFGSDTVFGGDGADFVDGGSGNDTIYGGDGADPLGTTDTIFGGDGADLIFGGDNISGGDGAEFIDAGAGNDTIFGGDGADELGSSSDTIFGGDGADEIFVGAGSDSIAGGDGADSINSGDGNDTIYGGDGADPLGTTDTIFGGDGADLIFGGDTISGGDGADVISAGSGNDTIYGGDGANDLGSSSDTVFGGDGADDIFVGAGSDMISGGDGADELSGGSGNDTIFGGDGADPLGTQDTIFGGDGADLIFGGDNILGGDGADFVNAGSGNDTIYGGDGADLGSMNDTIFGGDGADEIFVGAGGDSISGGDGADSISTGDGNDTIYGGDGADPLGTTDTIFGGDGADFIFGGDGISGGDGADVITAGDGNDTIYGGDGAESLGASSDTIFGGDGADDIFVGAGSDMISGGDGADEISGGSGNDTIFGGDGADPLGTQDTIFGGDGADLIFGGDNILGGDGADFVDAGSGNDTIYGGDGADLGSMNDTISGGDGADEIFVGAGNDSVQGGDGADSISSGGGDDTIYGGDGADPLGTTDTIFGGDGADFILGGDAISGGDGADIISGGAGNDTIYGGDGADSLGSSSDTIFGGDGADEIFVGAGSDMISGGDGADELNGGSGSDTIFGGDGADPLGTQDTIFGGDGADLIFGGDNISGGDGADFVDAGSGNDTIYGGDGADLGSMNDTISGGDGADEIFVGAGHDSVQGGDGADSISSGGGDDTIYGGDGADPLGTTDTIFGGDGADFIFGGDGISGGDGADVISAGDGNDTIYGGDGANDLGSSSDTVFGGDGADDIFVGAGSDSISGGDGADEINAGGGTDTIFGGDGADPTSTDDSIFGGDGADLIFAGDNILGGDGADFIDAGGGNDTILGGDGADPIEATDTIYGGDGADLIFGGDNISGGDGADFIDAGAGNDTILGGDGADPLGPTDTIYGGDGADLIFGGDLITGGDGADFVDAGSGNDTIYGGDGAEELGSGSDTVFGGDGADEIYAGSGTDSIEGGDGADLVVAGNSGDTISGGDGADLIFGGDDSIGGGDGADIIVLGLGNDTVYGGDGADLIDGTVDSIFGGDGADSIDAGSGNDTIYGGDGADIVLAGDGSDSVQAGDGADFVSGGGGTNILNAGDGSDSYAIATGSTNTVTDSGGIDLVDFGDATQGVVFDLQLGGTQSVDSAGTTVTLVGTFEGAIGSSFSDSITGSGEANAISGSAGADVLSGGDGDDVIEAGATQVVYLDFDTNADPWSRCTTAMSGSVPVADCSTLIVYAHQYTAAERAAILGELEADYAEFDVNFTLAPPVSGQFSTLFFNKVPLDGNQPFSGGKADEFDWRNRHLSGTVSIHVTGLLTRTIAGFEFFGETSENYVAASVNIASHELGHLMGLRHGDAFGPIGSGIFDPGAVFTTTHCDGVLKTGVDLRQLYCPNYTGPADAIETGVHLMASPAALHNDIGTWTLGDDYFGEREAIKIEFARSGSVVTELSGPHGDAATAQTLSLAGLPVPNTLLAGAQNAGQSFAVRAIDVIASITLGASGQSESDFYTFTATAGDIINLDVVSRALGSGLATIDPVARILDLAGNELAINDDEFETQDSSIIDFVAPATGTYVIEVRPFCTAVGGGCVVADTGNYELFVTSFALGATLGLDSTGDALVGGAGSDLLVGSLGRDVLDGGPGNDEMFGRSGDDTFRFVATTASDSDVADGGSGTDMLDLRAAPALSAANVQQASIEAVSFQSVAGAAVSNEGSTYTLTLASGALVPTGWSINWGDGTTDAISGNPASVTHSYDDGPSGHTVNAFATYSDGSFAALPLTASVLNVAPTASISLPGSSFEGTPTTLSGSALDPSSADNGAGFTFEWTVTKNGSAYASGSGSSFTFTPNDEGTYSVSLCATDKDGDAGCTTATVTAANAAPLVAAITGPTPGPVGVPGQLLSFASSFSDAGPLDTHTVTWTFGDGTAAVGPVSATAGAIASTHIFTATGTFTISVTVLDSNGAATTVTQSVTIATVAIQTGVICGPGGSAGTALVVGGSNNTALPDYLVVNSVTGTPNALNVKNNGTDLGTFTTPGGFSRIILYAQAGNDRIQVVDGITLPSCQFGGDGNDNLNGGGGTNILLGGNGNDILNGGNGRDLMIGGFGGDTMNGNASDDIMVAGYTDHDANDLALSAIMNEWVRTDIGYSTRVSHLLGSGVPANGSSPAGSTGGQNGSYFLFGDYVNSSGVLIVGTSHDDNVKDTLKGNAGVDWFLANLNNTGDSTAGVLDAVTSSTGEATSDID